MKKFIWLLMSIFLLLSACHMPTTCDDPEDLIAPVIQDPPMWAVVDSLTPTLSWAYSGDCTPEKYLVKLYFIGGEGGGNTGDSSTEWTPMLPLDPATEYAWTVQPMVGSSMGPIDGRSYFFTGPMCETADLVAPDLVEPADGAIINDDYPSFLWDYPDPCLPEGYRIDLSTDPSFDDTSLSGGTGNPSTRWGPGEHLDDCTQYYWRVAPINDITLGPFSGTYAFFVDDSSSCLTLPEPSIARIDVSGVIFEDICPIPPDGLLPTTLPEGCVGEEDGTAHADGKRKGKEPGIAGITVDLGSGPCPSTGLATTVTDGKGFYSFTVQTPGEYCISVNAEGANAEILLPGRWTLVPSENMGYTFRHVEPDPGVSMTGLDFGWDYAGLGCPFYELDMNAFCRAGPSQVFHKVTTGLAGDQLPIVGRLEDNSWFLVQVGDGQCWISDVVGSTECALDEVPVLTPPKPTDTPTLEPDKEEEPYCAQFTTIKTCTQHETDGCKWNYKTEHCDGP